MAVPIITLAQVTGLPLNQVASMVGRQTPLLAVFVPLVLVFIVDGRRGLREAWVPALGCGLVFALAQFATSNYLSVPLTDIVASLLGAAAVIVLARVRPNAVWAKREPAIAAGGGPGTAARPDSPADVRLAYAPYVIIILVFAIVQLPFVKPLRRRPQARVPLAVPRRGGHQRQAALHHDVLALPGCPPRAPCC